MIKIIALGNSLTEGFGLSRGENLVDVLESRLKEKGIRCLIINGGVSGDTTSGGLSRTDRYLGNRPDIFMIELGINDALLEYPLTEIKENLRRIIQKVLSSGAQALLIGTDIPEEFPDIPLSYRRDYSLIFEELAKEFQIPLCHHLLEGIAGEPAYTLFDLLHPNSRGVEKMAEKIIDTLEEMIEEISPKNHDIKREKTI